MNLQILYRRLELAGAYVLEGNPGLRLDQVLLQRAARHAELPTLEFDLEAKRYDPIATAIQVRAVAIWERRIKGVVPAPALIEMRRRVLSAAFERISGLAA